MEGVGIDMSEKRLVYPDILRIIAIFAVIVIHATANILTACPPSSAVWRQSNIISAAARFAVPVFFMVSGIFFLDPEREVSAKKMFLRSIPRLIVALIFWSLLYEVYPAFTAWLKTGKFDFSVIVLGLKKILYGNEHFHLYFIYLIAGLYLITPLLRVFTKNATRRQTEYFLLLFFLCSGVIPFLLKFAPFSNFARVFNKMGLHMVTGYVGYFLAGHYLNKYNFGKKAKVLLYISGIAAIITACIGTVYLSSAKSVTDVLLYEGLSPFSMIYSAAVFVFVKNLRCLNALSAKASNRIAWASKTTFGIYLMHDFLNIALRGFNISLINYPPFIAVPIYSVGTFLLCMLISGLLLKIPVARKWIV